MTSPLEELDLPAWVGRAEKAHQGFREAVHIVLHSISSSAALRTNMVMKGGLLMAIRYDSGRFTRDADFSTREKYQPGAEQLVLQELKQQLATANELLPYDTMCRVQRSEVRPKRADASFPTLALSIGYAPRSNPAMRQRLMAGQAPTIVEIDYSYNEAVLDVQVLRVGDGDELHAYSHLNLLAEKLRSLLQQPERGRYRRQDVYDIHLLAGHLPPLDESDKQALLRLLITSCTERHIEARLDSMENEQVRLMAEKEYATLSDDVEGVLPDFDVAFATVRSLYRSLPWAEP